jgi:lipid-A-disaccharide synthase
MSRLVTIEYIGLANIVAAKPVVRELLQDQATADNISGELFRLLDDENYREKVQAGLAQVKHNLGEGKGSQQMAELVLSCLQQSCPD